MRCLRYPGSSGQILGVFLVALVWLQYGGVFADQDYNNAEGYICSDSGQTSCDTFVLYRSRTGYSGVQTISSLFNASATSVAELNNLTTTASVPTNGTVFVPIDCRCSATSSGNTSSASLSYVIKSGDTYTDLSTDTFESLTTVAAINSTNSARGVSPNSLQIGQEIVIPVRCACPSAAQLSQGVKALVTYPVVALDTLEGIAASFGISLAEVQSTNTISSDAQLLSGSSLLIPITTSQPRYQQTLPSISHGKGKGSGVIIGVVVGSVVVGIIILCCLAWALWAWHPTVRKWRLGDYVVEEEFLELSSGTLRRVSYQHLSVATKGFSDQSKLGEGGFGSVYKGVLPTTGTPIAVKRISPDSNQGEREFMTEVSIISQLRHRNLIQLLGYCKDRGRFLIVYELMPNGSLDKALFLPAEAPNVLSWDQRFNIVLGTARAVSYLHQGFKQQVIHRDIKASNIMLDEKWDAKLGDFGLARLVDHLLTVPTTMVAGTYGYIAPEAATGKFTDKTDVFAFGAVVLEVACGRRSLAMGAPVSERILVDWVWQRLAEGKLLSVVDRRLTEFDTYRMETMLLLGLLCSHPDPGARPSMSYVVQVLSGEVPVPPVPSTKPSVSFRRDYKTITIDEIHDPKHESLKVSSGPASSAFSGFSATESASKGSSEALLP